MSASLQLPGGLKTLNPQPEITRYYNIAGTPYISTAQVVSEVVPAARYIGQTFLVVDKEYWFSPSTADINLIEKIDDASILASGVVTTPHTDYLTGANAQLQFDQTETNLVNIYKIGKTDFKNLYQTGRARVDADVSISTISPANTLTITAVDDILFVNEILINTNANKLANYLLSFGSRVFVANGTNTPLAVNTRGIFYVGIDKLGNSVYVTSKVYNQDVCYLARLIVDNTGGVYTIFSSKYIPDLANNRINNRDRLVISTGYIVPSGAASISFGNRAVTYFKNSINYSINKLDPNYLQVPDTINPAPMQFLFALPNLSSLATSIALSTVLNPTQWYTAGGAVGGGAVAGANYQVYKLLVSVTGTLIIQTKASTSNAPAFGVNAIFANRDDALAGLTSTVFPPILPAGDSIPLGTFYLRAGTAVNGSQLADPNDFYFLPITSSLSSSTAGVTVHDLLSGKNDNPAFQHVTTTDITNWNIAFTNRITSLTTVGSSGPATLIANVLNIPNYNAAGAPITGTGVAGQVTFWNDPSSVMGDIGFTWNNVNKALTILSTSGSNLILSKSTGASLQIDGATGTASPIVLEASNSLTPDLLIYAGGTEKMRIGSAGAVTVGTSIQNYGTVLTLKENDTNIRGLSIVNRNANSSWQFFVDANAVDDGILAISQDSASRVVVKKTGEVGIGTTNPLVTLDVNKTSQTLGSTVPNGALIISNKGAGNGVLELGNIGDGNTWLQSRNNASATFYNLLLNPSGGYVGIGTTTPDAALHISLDNSVTAIKLNSTTAGSGNIQFYNQGTRKWGLETDSVNNLMLYNWDSIAPGIGGARVFVSNSTGNIGIGTMNPEAPFVVSHDGSASIETWINTFGNGGGLRSINRTTAEPREFFYDAWYHQFNTGNVSIGSSGPTEKLHVFGTIAADNTNGGSFKVKSGGIDRWIFGGDSGEATTNFNFYNYTTSSVSLSIKQDNGNVGIGTTNPTNKLEVVGSGLFTGRVLAQKYSAFPLTSYSGLAIATDSPFCTGQIFVPAADAAAFTPIVSGNTVITGIGYQTLFTMGITRPDNSNGEGIFQLTGDGFGTAYVWRFRRDGGFTAQGSVGIGTDAPTNKLHVVGAILGTTGVYSGGGLGFTYGGSVQATGYTYSKVMEAGYDGSYDFTGFYTPGASAANADMKMKLRGDGNFGIGQMAPTQRLHVTGNILASGSITPSDLRLKSNIRELPSMLDSIMKMKPKIYEKLWSKDSVEKNKEIGFIAQDLQEVFDYEEIISVQEDEDKTLTVNYNSLIAVLVKGMQELKEEVDSLKEIIDSLQ